MRATERVRWLVLGPILGLVLIVAGVVALEAVHPQLEDADMTVAGVPPLAVEGTVSCVRRANEPIEPVAADFRPGGRISSEQVFACPQAYDGLHVSFVGEVIGDLIAREDGVWVQVNDDAYALAVGPLVGHREHAGFNTGLAVWLPNGLHESITDVGGPARRGDVVLVEGQLLRADPADGGGTTLRAQQLTILAPSETVDPPLHVLQLAIAVGLACLALGSVIWARRRRTR